jgi:hypothetical protein
VQNAAGTLEPFAVAEVPYSSRYRADGLAVADLDGNRTLDVALVDRAHGLTTLFNTLGTAPTARITTPPEASLVPPGPLTVAGTASADAVAVEVRLRGSTDWQSVTLVDGTWQTDFLLPLDERAWWIEVRAIDAAGNYQAPVDRQRIHTDALDLSSFQCVPVTVEVNGTDATGLEQSTLTLPTDAVTSTLQLGGVAGGNTVPDVVTVAYTDSTTTELLTPTLTSALEDGATGYSFVAPSASGLLTVTVPNDTARALVGYTARPTDTLASGLVTTTLLPALPAGGPALLTSTLPAPLNEPLDLRIAVTVMGDANAPDAAPLVLRAAAGGVEAEQTISATTGLTRTTVTLPAVPAGTEQVVVSLAAVPVTTTRVVTVPDPGVPEPEEPDHDPVPEPGRGVAFLLGATVLHDCTLTAQEVPSALAANQVLITPEAGGSLTIDDITIAVPPGAVSTATVLEYQAEVAAIQQRRGTTAAVRTFGLRAFTLDAAAPVAQFAQPYTLSVGYTSDTVDETTLGLLTWDTATQRWTPVVGNVDTSSRQVVTRLHTLSSFQLMGTLAQEHIVALPFVR